MNISAGASGKAIKRWCYPSVPSLQEVEENVACSLALDPVMLLVATYYRQMPQPKRSKMERPTDLPPWQMPHARPIVYHVARSLRYLRRTPPPSAPGISDVSGRFRRRPRRRLISSSPFGTLVRTPHTPVASTPEMSDQPTPIGAPRLPITRSLSASAPLTPHPVGLRRPPSAPEPRQSLASRMVR